MSHMIQKLQLVALRGFFTISGNWFPSFTLNVLWKKLFTIPKKKAGSNQARILRKARTFSFEFPDPLQGNKPIRLLGYRWGIGGRNGRVLLLHGWEDNAGAFYNFVPALVEEGYEVISYDAPAHGKSQGIQSSLPHFILALECYIKRFGLPYAIIGHSMGGTSTGYYLSESQQVVDRLILLNAPIVPKQFFEWVGKRFRIPKPLQESLYDRIKEKLGIRVEQFDLKNTSSGRHWREALFIHDTADKLVDPNDVRRFCEQTPGLALKMTTGLGHNHTIKDTGVLQSILTHLKNKPETAYSALPENEIILY